jgi:hypothetical protein
MSKIPVGKTVAFAYGFTFGDFPAVLGIVWLPLGLILALSYFLTIHGAGNARAMLQAGDYGAAGEAARSLALLSVASLVLQSMATVGVTSQALGLRHGTPVVYFSLGAAVWRLVGASILVFLLFIVFEIVLAIGIAIFALIAALVVGGIASVANGHAGISPPATVLLVVICLFAFFGGLIYIAARLMYLIAPVVVAEEKIDLVRGWSLTQGNFWRIVAIVLAIALPLSIVGVIAAILLYGGDMFPPVGEIVQHVGDQKLVQQTMDAWSQHLQARTLDIWPIAYGLQFVLSVLTTGLTAGAAAFAYRALVPPKPVADQTALQG